MIPAVVVSLHEFPRTAAGKIDRRALPPPAERGPRGHRAVKRRDPLENRLGRIWEQVLCSGPVGLRDDFFADWAGSSLQAAAVVTEIERATGIRLPLSEMVRNSTIESLARRLEGQVFERSNSPLLLLKPGTRTPLFLVHRGHGGLYGYRQLLPHLAGDQTVYGLQSLGLQGECWPLASLPEMARRYVREIRTVQPRGPYLLAGMCMGGLIALEMAQELVACGETVAFLGLIDTTYPGHNGVSPIGRGAETIRHRLDSARWRAAWALDRLTGRRFRLTGQPAFRGLIVRMNARALHYYRPRPYPGTIEIFIGDQCIDGRELEFRMAVGRLARTGWQLHRPPGLREDMLMPPAVSIFGPLLQSRIDAAVGPTA